MGKRITDIRAESSVVFFAKTANISRLNKAIQYVRDNEDANHCRVVHVYEDESSIPTRLLQCCHILDTIYPSIRIDVVLVKGTFGPSTIMKLHSEWEVPPNLMFMTCPTSEQVGKRIQDLHGVRVIMSHEEDNLIEKYGSTTHSVLDDDRVLSEILAAGPGIRRRAYSESAAFRMTPDSRASNDPQSMPVSDHIMLGDMPGGAGQRQAAARLIPASYS